MDDTSKSDCGLAAILLLTKAIPGTRLVCHWPPEIETKGEDRNEQLLLGYPVELLERFLGAGPWSNGKMVEITLGDVSFISCSSFMHDKDLDEETSLAKASSVGRITATDQQNRLTALDGRAAQINLDTLQLSTSASGTSADSFIHTPTKSTPLTLSMIQVVFAFKRHGTTGLALTPSTIFNRVAKPFVSSLQKLQEHDAWLAKECHNIAIERAKSRTGFTGASDSTSHTSELVWAMKAIFEAIGNGSIAQVRLHGMHMALDTTEVSGVDVTTHSLPTIHLAVLLLEEKSRLLEEIDQAPASAALAFFITHVVATKSLSKLAVKLKLDIDAVVFLAQHLVKWRKARLIAPLHARNTYVVDPDARLEDLQRLGKDYSRRFPALPNLQTVLATLGAPVPTIYNQIFPSRAHGDMYMDMLTWLTRHNLVIRLRTIGWLCASQSLTDSDQTPSASKAGSRVEAVGPTGRALILDPRNLSPDQRRSVRALTAILNQEHGLDVLFAQVLLHLDGRHTLEDIALLESLKRADVEKCLQALNDLDVLQTVQCL